MRSNSCVEGKTTKIYLLFLREYFLLQISFFLGMPKGALSKWASKWGTIDDGLIEKRGLFRRKILLERG